MGIESSCYHSACSFFQHINEIHLDHESVTPLPFIDSLMESRAVHEMSYHVARLLMKWGQMSDDRHIEAVGVWQPLVTQSLLNNQPTI